MNGFGRNTDKKNSPGTCLRELIPSWAVKLDSGCPCDDFAKKMDDWGTSGCIERRQEILSHILAQEEHLKEIFRLLPKMAKEIVARKLVDKAIEMSE